ncbi:hypothetical protein NMY22_g8124 [Coprinellus aureogranulatus]|nr:hypothetical protein NMY22_g8124 [Coprinellus aureogranulatus]
MDSTGVQLEKWGTVKSSLRKGFASAPPGVPPPPAKEEDLFDKIGSVLGHKPTPPPEPQERNDLFSQITDTISGKKQEPAKPQGLGDKINHALGGGAKGEEEEAIDLFQEHVLKEGQQHNESALEQLKDNQIESTIRKTSASETRRRGTKEGASESHSSTCNISMHHKHPG